MSSRILDEILWLTPPVVQVISLLWLYRRRANRVYPWFCYYLVLQVAVAAVLFCVEGRSPTLYFLGYWIASGLAILFSIGVIRDVLTESCRGYSPLKDLGTVLSRWAMHLALLVACIGPFVIHHPTATGSVVTGIVFATTSVRSMQLIVLLFLIFCGRYLGMPRGILAFGIALGFGVFAFAEVAAESTALSTRLSATMRHQFEDGAYLVACLIWLWYSVANSPKLSAAEPGDFSKAT